MIHGSYEQGFADGRVERRVSGDGVFLSEGAFMSPLDVADSESLEAIREVDKESFHALMSAQDSPVDWIAVWSAARPLAP